MRTTKENSKIFQNPTVCIIWSRIVHLPEFFLLGTLFWNIPISCQTAVFTVFPCYNYMLLLLIFFLIWKCWRANVSEMLLKGSRVITLQKCCYKQLSKLQFVTLFGEVLHWDQRQVWIVLLAAKSSQLGKSRRMFRAKLEVVANHFTTVQCPGREMKKEMTKWGYIRLLIPRDSKNSSWTITWIT